MDSFVKLDCCSPAVWQDALLNYYSEMGFNDEMEFINFIVNKENCNYVLPDNDA